jgi:hypothetical protein
MRRLGTPSLAGLALLAVVGAAWFALGIRQADGLARAATILGSTRRQLTPGQVAEVRSALAEAAPLDPDRSVELDRSLLELDRGRQAAALRTAERVARSEPQNIRAWIDVALASSRDRREFLIALERIHRLEPRIP